MMYNNKLVASIKANGKVLREFKDTVYIPFGSEYSILLKNLNTVKAIVNIYIDGDNVVPGGLVLNAGQECDLQRAIRNGNLTEGNKFKFIERTSNVEDHRGIKLEDGLIRVEFQFEKTRYQLLSHSPNMTWAMVPASSPYYANTAYTATNAVLRSSGYAHDSVACTDMSYAATNMAVGATLSASSAAQSETGITVPGSKSEQKFVTTSSFETETEKHNIILKLLGETEDNKAIREPITVKKKPKCVTCGKQNKATAKFCVECGTALEIFA